MWPPVGAVPVDVADAYEQLTSRGYEYGPAFQGLHAMWRLGDDEAFDLSKLRRGNRGTIKIKSQPIRSDEGPLLPNFFANDLMQGPV